MATLPNFGYRFTTNLGLALFGADQEVINNFELLDEAFGSIVSGPILQTDNVTNTIQSKLNLKSGTDISLVADAFGGVTINGSGDAQSIQGVPVDPTIPSHNGEILIFDSVTNTYIPGDPLVQGIFPEGHTATGVNPVLVAGKDNLGNLKDLNLDASGALIVSVSSVVAGTVNQGNQGSIAQSWFVELTNGTNVIGTLANPIRTDPTGTTTQPVSGTVTAITGGLTDTQLRAAPVPVSLASTTITGTVAVTQSTSPWVVSLASTTITGTVAENLTQVAGVVLGATAVTAFGTAPAAANVPGVNSSLFSGTTALTNTGGALNVAVASGTIAVTQTYNVVAPTPTNGQSLALQSDLAGNLKTVPGIASFTGAVWTSATALNATQTLVTNAGSPSVLVQLDQTSTITGGAVTFQGTYDDINWITVPAVQILDPALLTQISMPYTLQASNNKAFFINMVGLRQLRLLLSTAITGTGSVTPFVTELAYDPVVITSGTSVVSGTITANQGSPAITANAWPTKLVDSGGVNVASISATGRLQVTVADPLPVGTNVIGHVIADTGSTTAVTGNVTVVQPTGTNLHVVTDATSVTNATLSAETTKTIGTVRILGNGGDTLDSTVGAGTAPTNQQVVGSVYNTTAPAPTTGQAMAQQADVKGSLFVNTEGRKATYCVSGGSNAPANNTAISSYVMYGSSTKKIKIVRIAVSFVGNAAAAAFEINIKKYSTQPTGGTATSLIGNIAKMDSGDAAATPALLQFYTVSPTEGTAAGFIAGWRTIYPTTTVTTNSLAYLDFREIIFGNGVGRKPITLNNQNEGIGLTISNVNLNYTVDLEWTEE